MLEHSRYATRPSAGLAVNKFKMYSDNGKTNTPFPHNSIMSLILLSILSAYNGTVGTLNLTGRDEPLCPESCRCPLKRTLFGIAWSCLSTTILCAWTAVHPNVPPRSKWQARWNRLKLMFWMIVAPELVLAWAVRQFFAAKDIRDMYNKRKGVYQGLREWADE